jgi:eukaryotic-like serine/threonine-protein kinase
MNPLGSSSLSAGESREPRGSPVTSEGTADRYAIYEEIGAGGMATVHLGRLMGPANFARTVAIKRLHPHLARQSEFVAMFLDEARVAARVRHPNVVTTLDVVTTSAQPYLVMEYVRGESLARLQSAAEERAKHVPPTVACAIVVGILHGLHAAHEATNERGESLAIVHRDVSPQNVMVGSDGVARVLDFGVAKAAGRLQTTREGRLKGKLAYTAPELVRGEAVSRAADVYSVGVVLWELLAGERLFTGDNEANVLERVLFAEVAAPSRRAPDVPPELDAIVLRALARDPVDRFSTAREMARAIEHRTLIASGSEVGEWVEGLAGETLLDRARKTARIESGACPPLEDLPGDEGSLSETEAARGRSRRALAVSLPWIAVVGVAIALLAHRGDGAAPSRASARAPLAAPPQALIEPAATASAPAVASTPAETAATASAPSPAPRRAVPVVHPIPLPTPRARPAQATTAKPSCDPPWTLDPDGLKKYKLDCL